MNGPKRSRCRLSYRSLGFPSPSGDNFRLNSSARINLSVVFLPPNSLSHFFYYVLRACWFYFYSSSSLSLRFSFFFLVVVVTPGGGGGLLFFSLHTRPTVVPGAANYLLRRSMNSNRNYISPDILLALLCPGSGSS